MPLVQTQAPAAEPLTLAEVKLHLRVDDDITEFDSKLTRLIKSARRYAELETRRSLITQKWALVLDSFAGGMTPGFSAFGATYTIPSNAVVLERGPVQSIDSITYVDMGGVTQTVTTPAAPSYAIDLTGPLARIAPGFGRIWPIPLPQIGAVRFDYTAGYGAAGSDVPPNVLDWMLAAIETMYRNPGVLIQLERGARVDAFDWIAGLLDDVRVVTA